MQELTWATNLEKFITINGTCWDMIITKHAYLRTSLTADSLDDMPTFSNNASNLV
jgi:SPX domain protein involved in polyphosphate accumulation